MGISGKIKVLETIRQGYIGGGETHVLGLVDQMDKFQFEPVVLSFTDGQMVGKLQKRGIKCYVIPSRHPFDFKKWEQVRGLLKKEKIDLVHVHGTRAASNLFWAARSLRIPVVYTVHGWSFHDDQPAIVKKIRILAEKFLTKRMDANISVSASNQLTGKRYFSEFDSIVINNGIDQRKFNPYRDDYADIRKELGIPADCTLVVYIARITQQKDPLTMIRAFREAVNEDRNIRLLMVGDGELKEQAIELTRELSLGGNVIFEPFREDIPAILKATDIYCLPSLWEGLPIGLLEAMSMGNAVIATNVDGSCEIIKHGENGILVESRHPDQLANAILLLHYNEKLRQEFQQRAIRTVEERFNMARMTKKIESVYRRILYQNKFTGYEYS